MLSAQELRDQYLAYLEREETQHKRDIILAEGKGQEITELIRRIEDTCLYCGEFIYAYGTKEEKVARMAEHLKERHMEDVEAERERQENNAFLIA